MFNIIKELLKKNPDAREVYKSNSTQNINLSKKIREYNPEFSETFFMTWMSTTFIRYIFLASNHDEKIHQFEKVYLTDNAKKDWKEDLELYDIFKVVLVNHLDFIDYFHSEKEEEMEVRLRVIGKGLKEEDSMDVTTQKVLYYDIVLVKDSHKKALLTNITTNCPNCGAPTKITTYGTCDHCGQMVSIYDNVWKIQSLKLNKKYI